MFFDGSGCLMNVVFDETVLHPPHLPHPWVFLVTRLNPTLHVAPFLSTRFFSCLKPMLKNIFFLSVVAFLPSEMSDNHFPNIKNDAGQTK